MISLRAQLMTIEFEGRSALLTFKMPNTEALRSILNGKWDFNIRLTNWKEKRSLDANAYFHVLNDKIAKAIKQSAQYTKNMLIARYGQMELLNDKTLTYTTQAPPEHMMELEYIHSLLINIHEQDGLTWYTYRIYRGTHTYNTAEMSYLIDGTVSEAKQLGIETLPPNELERLYAKN